MTKPLLLNIVGRDDSVDGIQKDGSNRMRIFPRYLGHYSLKNEEGKWTLHKIGKNDAHWIFVNPQYMKNLLAGGKILVDEHILELEKIA
ncbi:hypothetical protein LCGC14_1606290 [marine sediment metagenome]|uniref:Uncharacterized protein n=1 Tax=marine sediment metagenome TaxID=412755 RepID=A0A0F9IW93_9ZZZZ